MGHSQKYRKIVFYKNYFQDFFSRQNNKVRAKIVWTFELIEDLQRVPETYLKHIEDTSGLYEIRVQLGKEILRIFCFFDEGQLVIVVNGFKKKTQKTPKNEIELALKIKADYENEKQ
jgi:phage-related protein